MRRLSLLLPAPLLPLALLISRYLRALQETISRRENYQERALMLEKLAANIRTPADARILINFVADLFTNQLLPTLTRDGIRERLAQREFRTVSDLRELIPAERNAEAWNAYAQSIEASWREPVS